MPYRRRRQKDPSIITVIVILAVAAGGLILQPSSQSSFPTETLRVYLLFALLVLLLILVVIWAFLFLTQRTRAQRFAALRAHRIDTMTGREFEEFLKHLLIARGYKARVIGGSGDNGIDLIAEKSEEKISIQAKRYGHGNYVSRRAISDALGGMRYHNCTSAMVITNSYFTFRAKDFAKGTGCTLIDREELTKWVAELHVTNPSIPSV